MVYVLKAPSDTLALALVWDSEQQFCSLHSSSPVSPPPGLAGLLHSRGGVALGTGKGADVGASQVVVQGAGSLGSWSPVLFLEFQCLGWTERGIVPASGYVRTAHGPRAGLVGPRQLQGLCGRGARLETSWKRRLLWLGEPRRRSLTWKPFTGMVPSRGCHSGKLSL